ncbi:type I-E CRISPR-associated protein Cas5/CasD [Kitasatospora brasiliensis]|uniref:type I-E CRISPR-associated protein Cas5/CasD n=1 Tax=Kitasatospora brasiliensis TaxID=3058040 RepID=UPI00292E0C94|nr:type I-E CRISPR-associated protein Cas5/CasD [Kitasatospora sp. K002]
MSGGLLLHLAAPLQSWGSPSQFGTRLTYPYPTRSGLTGLFGCVLGLPRGSGLGELAGLRYTVRIDRPGRLTRDYHTVGGGYPREETVITASGGRRPLREATMQSERCYLGDAAFTVAVTGAPAITDVLVGALREPVWHPYLGRRSCPPTSPILIAAVDDPVAELYRLPLHREPGKGPGSDPAEGAVEVVFVHDTDPGTGHPPVTQVRDQLPADGGRRFAGRPLWETRHTFTYAQHAGTGTAWIAALTTYTRTRT